EDQRERGREREGGREGGRRTNNHVITNDSFQMGEVNDRCTGRDPEDSSEMEEMGTTGRSHTFDGVIRSSRPNPMGDSSDDDPSSPEDLGFVDEEPDRPEETKTPHNPPTAEVPDKAAAKGMRQMVNKVPSDFYFHTQIGEGAYSVVYHATEVETNRNYAIKVVLKEYVNRKDKYNSIIREKNMMAYLTYKHKGHPFVVSLYCTFQDNERLYFAMSYCPGGDLQEMLRRVNSFDQTTTKFYSAEIISSLQFIHGCGIVHRDLKPENILIKENGHICLSDFGSAKMMNNSDDVAEEQRIRRINVDSAEDRGDRRATFVGTAQYVSPEMLNDSPVGPECDYWALGCMLYQMMSGQPPFRAVNSFHLMRTIQNLEFTFPPGFPVLGLNLVKRLLVLNPEERLGNPLLPSIMDDPFYEGIDFATLDKQTPPAIHPYIPASMGEPEFYSDVVITPGFDKETINRLELEHLAAKAKKQKAKETMPESKATPTSAPPGHEEGESKEERMARMRASKFEKQKEENDWHQFAEENLILREGLVDKKKGLFARRRMFLLTEGPHIYYIDPINKVYKGQIPICFETKTEAKNFRTFFVHTPNRTYYLLDPSRRANEWCAAIDKVRDRYFKEPTPRDENEDIIEITRLFGIIPFITIKTTRAARLAKEKKIQEQKERKERTERAKKERLAREKEEKREKKRLEEIEKAEKKAEKERKRRERKLGRK
ncbi:hypothetical protein PMAYCL1PPCAC_30768, partial [Pristionchus mayeri]